MYGISTYVWLIIVVNVAKGGIKNPTNFNWCHGFDTSTVTKASPPSDLWLFDLFVGATSVDKYL